MTSENITTLSTILFAVAIITTFSITIYSGRQKKKLSDQDIIDFEKNIKPKILKLVLLITIPTLALCFHAMTCPGDIKTTFVSICAILSFIISTSVYYRSKAIIKNSGRQKEYNFITNYVLFFGLTQLIMIAALTCMFLEYVNK